MIKSKELQDRDIKQIYDKYKDELSNYGINSLNDLKVYSLPDYLAQRYSNKFGPENSNYNNYQNDKNLNEVYVFKSNEETFFYGTENAVIKGHIANENLKDGKIKLSKELSGVTSEVIFSKDHNKLKNFEENFFHGNGKDLENLEYILEKRGNFSKKINERAKQIDNDISEIKIDSKNKATVLKNQNKEAKKDDEKENDDIKKEEQKQELNNSNLPEHIVKYCIMAGIVVPKAVIDTKANEAYEKIDEPRINRNGGKVTIIKVRDDSKSVDKYLVFQDGKLIIPGNRDDKIDKIVGRTMQHTKDGNMIKPLEIDEKEQYFKYSDSFGINIREKIEENVGLSIDKLENYKKRAKELLEKFSQELYKVEESDFLTKEQKNQLYNDANNKFNIENEKLSLEFGINYRNVKSINLKTDEKTNEKIIKENDEPDAWEVPGKIKRGE